MADCDVLDLEFELVRLLFVEDPERQSLCEQYTYFQELKDYIRREITCISRQVFRRV
jgi:hypothetical protein